jgi:hypothetical protein
MDSWIHKQYDELRTIEEQGVSPRGILAPFHDALEPALLGTFLVFVGFGRVLRRRGQDDELDEVDARRVHALDNLVTHLRITVENGSPREDD